MHLFIPNTMFLKGLYEQDIVMNVVNMRAMIPNMK